MDRSGVPGLGPRGKRSLIQNLKTQLKMKVLWVGPASGRTKGPSNEARPLFRDRQMLQCISASFLAQTKPGRSPVREKNMPFRRCNRRSFWNWHSNLYRAPLEGLSRECAFPISRKSIALCSFVFGIQLTDVRQTHTNLWTDNAALANRQARKNSEEQD